MVRGRHLVLGVYIFFLLSGNLAYGNMGTFLEKFLGNLEDKKLSAFFSGCGLEKVGQYNAKLIFEMETKKGLLIESKNNEVINLAQVFIKDGNPVIGDTHGGIYSYERVKELVHELMGKKFYLLAPFKIKDFEDIKLIDVCAKVP